MEKISLALDWTPNINHIGFFVAKEKEFYAQEGIEVALISPSEDDYSVTPAKKVELGKADFALCPMESILSYRTKETPFDLQAIAAIYQEDLSAIVCMKSSGISSPKQLDGKSYASYQAKYEDEIVKQMIINDGGQGTIEITYPRKLGIWETIIKDQYDSTWVFMNWEGVQAKSKGFELTAFKMDDFGVPYSYSPVIAASEKRALLRGATYKKFLKASKKGFLYTLENKKEAAELLTEFVSKSDSDIDLEAAIQASADAFGDQSTWGKMNQENVKKYLDWIYEKGLETKPVATEELVSNAFL